MITVPSEELRVGDVGHSAVDNHAGIQHFERMLQAALTAEQATKRLQIGACHLCLRRGSGRYSHHRKVARLKNERVLSGIEVWERTSVVK